MSMVKSLQRLALGSWILIFLVAVGGGLSLYYFWPTTSTDGSGDPRPASAMELPRPVRVGIVTWGGYAGGIVANNGFQANKDCIFYRDHGIQVELIVIDDFAASRAAFRAGGDRDGVDILWSTVDAFALEYLALESLRPVAFLQYDWSYGGDAIAVGPGIESMKDLRDRKIAVAEDTPSHFFALFALRESGLSPQDVEFIFTASSPDSANIFKAGKADAVVAWSPDPQNAVDERKGSRVLMSTREASKLIADIFITRQEFYERYPDTLRAFTAGWLQGVDKVNENPDSAIGLMVQGFTGITEDDARGMLGDVRLPNYADNRIFFEVDRAEVYGYDTLFDIATAEWLGLRKIDRETEGFRTRMNTVVREIADRFPHSTPTSDQVKGEIIANQPPIVRKPVMINFAPNKWDLGPDDEADLKGIANTANAFNDTYLRISGHTDNVGERWYNKYLSLKRALSVVDKLQREYDIAPSRFISIEGEGPDRPLNDADPLTKMGRARLRRTEVEVFRSGEDATGS